MTPLLLRIAWPMGWNFSITSNVSFTFGCSTSTILKAVILTELYLKSSRSNVSRSWKNKRFAHGYFSLDYIIIDVRFYYNWRKYGDECVHIETQRIINNKNGDVNRGFYISVHLTINDVNLNITKLYLYYIYLVYIKFLFFFQYY